MRDEVRSLDVAAYAEGHSFTLTGSGEPVRLTGTRVSAELFSILGVRPALGRWLRRGDDCRRRTATWSSATHCGQTGSIRTRRIVGRSIQLDGVSREVVAVMPPSFQFPSARTQIWVPLGLDRARHRRVLGRRLHADRRPPAARRDDGAGADGRPRVPVAHRRALPVADARRRGIATSTVVPLAGGARRRRPPAAADPDCRRRAGAGDRLRERRESQPVARDRARARDRRPDRDRRGAAAHRAATADRKRHPRARSAPSSACSSRRRRSRS